MRFWEAKTSHFQAELSAPLNWTNVIGVWYSPDKALIAMGGPTTQRASTDPDDPNIMSEIYFMDAKTLIPRRAIFIYGKLERYIVLPDADKILAVTGIESENSVAGHSSWGTEERSDVYDAKTGEVLPAIKPLDIMGLEHSSDGTLAATAGFSIEIWTVPSANFQSMKVQELKEFPTYISGKLDQQLQDISFSELVAFTPDSADLISVERDGAVRLWHLKR